MVKVEKVRMLDRGMLLYKDKKGEYQWIFRPETTFIQSLYSLVMSPITLDEKRVGYIDRIYVEGDTCYADVFVESGFEEYLKNRNFRVTANTYYSDTEEYLIETNRVNIEVKLNDKFIGDYERVYDEQTTI